MPLDTTTHASGLPLDTLGKMIIANLDKADQAFSKAQDLRLAAGLHLLEAQQRVKAGEAGSIGWIDWCKVNVPKKSMRYIQLLIAPHKTDDPESALAGQREGARTSMAKTRANANNVVRMNIAEGPKLQDHAAIISMPVVRAIAEAGIETTDDLRARIISAQQLASLTATTKAEIEAAGRAVVQRELERLTSPEPAQNNDPLIVQDDEPDRPTRPKTPDEPEASNTVKKADRRSRPQRWHAALELLIDLLDEYQDWRDNLPKSQEDSATAEKLEAVLELRDMVEELQGADLPKGFGRD